MVIIKRLLIPGYNLYCFSIVLPFLYSSVDEHRARERVLWAIERVGLEKRLRHRPSELSGGEMQRTAIARAIAVNPMIVLADEPTGNLDSKTGLEILQLFQELHEEGTTIAMITHDSAVASHAQTVILIKDGQRTDSL